MYATLFIKTVVANRYKPFWRVKQLLRILKMCIPLVQGFPWALGLGRQLS